MANFYIHTMGCKSNQFEGSIIEETLIKNGYTKSDNIENSQIFILNSCSVTHKSDNEALYLLRNAKHKNPDIKTILTGCLAQIEKEQLLKYDFIDTIIGNNEKLNIINYLENDFAVSDIMELANFNPVILNDMNKTRASLKIQDGCDNRCSYCIIPFARGKNRSAETDFIIEQINNLVNHDFKEVVFTGIHIGQWGKDFGLNLLDLLKEVEKTQLHRYRLGSLNPSEINDELLDFLSKSEKFCPHFHLSLQSACDKTLKSMNRAYYNVSDYLKQIDKINSMFDLPFLGSDIITGFAGETDEDFEITKNNLEKSGLSQIHTFPYSIRQGTIGANMENQVPDEIKEKRATIVKEISKNKYKEFINKNIGKVREVLLEKHLDKADGNLKGVTKNYITVHTNANNLNLTNTLQKIRITKYENSKVYGEIL